MGIILFIAAIGIYFLPKQFSVSNSIVINKPIDVVYAQLCDFNTWGKWDPWTEEDPQSKTMVEGTPGAKGHKMSWDGAKVGVGSMTINWTKKNESIHSDLDFVKPFEGHDKDIWTLAPDGNTTKVTWTNTGGLPYPFARLFGLSVNSMMDKEHVKGLDNLKKYCESLPVPVATTDSTAAPQSM